LLALTGRLAAWMLYPAMLVLGISWVVDITARRTLALDLVGPDLIDNAMALEALSTAVALIFGVVAGGAIVGTLGAGQAFLSVAGLLVVAAGLIGATRPVQHYSPTSSGAGGEPARSPGIREALASRPLRSALGVTMLANFFYFSHTPLVPVFAERLDASPARAGLLAAALGLGMAVSAVAVARLRPPRGATYVSGAALALVAVVGLARATSFPAAFAASLVAAVGFGMFGSTQAVVTMSSVGPELRGRAMGLLSMAIGALPLGMYTLGEVAERIGPDNAVTVAAAVGVLALAGWLLVRPEVLRRSELS
jgi:predicted MFS family arabinose efflux permease